MTFRPSDRLELELGKGVQTDLRSLLQAGNWPNSPAPQAGGARGPKSLLRAGAIRRRHRPESPRLSSAVNRTISDRERALRLVTSREP